MDTTIHSTSDVPESTSGLKEVNVSRKDLDERNHLEALAYNLHQVVSVIHSMASENMHRATNTRGDRVFEISERIGDELFSLLYVADAFATAGLKEVGI